MVPVLSGVLFWSVFCAFLVAFMLFLVWWVVVCKLVFGWFWGSFGFGWLVGGVLA